MRKSATISKDGLYRYELRRRWGGFGKIDTLYWIMLNPSRADADLDDPTIRRCIKFSQVWGANALCVLNLYALRSTDPRALDSHPDPIGPENDTFLRTCLAYKSAIAAWGASADPGRARDVVSMLAGIGVRLQCLGTTKDGAPRHPLYVRGDTPLVDWREPWPEKRSSSVP